MEESFTTQKILKPSELKSLNKKSDFMGFFQLGSHAGAIIFLGYLHYLAIESWWVLLTGGALGIAVDLFYAGQPWLLHLAGFQTKKSNGFF